MIIALISENRYLWQKLRLMLPGDEVVLSGADYPLEYDRIIWDNDSARGTAPSEAITISRIGGKLTPAFSLEELISALGNTPRLTISKAERSATLDGHCVKLTEVEFSLLTALMEAEGKYVSRNTLIERVWGGAGNDGLINVYIHYLRQKLETGTERLIFSSRKEGYRLNAEGGKLTNAHN